MRFLKTYPILCIFFILAEVDYLNAQVVNIESERLQTDTTGWAGNARAGFTAIKDVEEIYILITEAHVQYKNERNLYLFKGSTNLTRAAGTDFSNNSFAHLRHNYKINKWLRWEAFTQAQSNQVSGIRFRYLLGSGPRFKIHESQKFVLYNGYAPMYEYEENKIEDYIVYNRDFRLSSYLSFTIRFSDQFRMASTTYYQPLLTRIEDYRIATHLSVSLKINKRFSIDLIHRLAYDEYPVPGIPRYSYSLENFLNFQF